jgi:NAD(P)-dependent dehydrogenase (short-subunit alcohol dehydrogenase family)
MALNWFSLEGKIALVTGTGTGMGAAVAKALAESGADVACHDRGGEARPISGAIRALGRRSVALSADLSQRDAQDALIANAVKEFGRIDMLVNNAGLIRARPPSTTRTRTGISCSKSTCQHPSACRAKWAS